MAGFYDDDDFSLSGLTQEGHDFVTVIESSSDDENYHGLLDCARQLAGESDKSSLEGGMQGGVGACCGGLRCRGNCVEFADS